jgi:TatA/E family protein of Tat protein translocase
MFGTLGGPELFLILVVALIVFGPRKLPEIGKSLGRMMNEFKKASNEFRQTLEDEVEADKIRESVRLDAPAPAPPSPPAPADKTPEPVPVPAEPAAEGMPVGAEGTVSRTPTPEPVEQK